MNRNGWFVQTGMLERFRQHFSLLAGPHPRSLSLGARASRGCPPAPRSGRWRFSLLAGPHPRSLSLGGPPAPRSGRRRYCLLPAACCLLILAGCRQDMHNQPKYRPLRPTAFFNDGSSARPLVDGTVARGALHEDEAFFTGKTGAALVRELPIAVDEQVMDRGEERYNIFCAPCHDRTGSGRGMVVQRGYRQPPSFHEPRLRQAEAGHFFDVMTNGFGAMPDYKVQIAPRDRWAIVAYIRALQMSQPVAPPSAPPSAVPGRPGQAPPAGTGTSPAQAPSTGATGAERKH